jgi:alanine-synthesizing transaminase
MMRVEAMPEGNSRIPISLPARVKALPPYVFGELNSLKYRKRCAGVDVIDLGMGNPNDPTPDPIIAKLCEAIHDKRNHRYSDAVGVLNLRKEVAKRYKKKWGVDVDAESEVVCTIGSKEGISHLCLAMLEHGDTVISPNPCYPIHRYGPTLAGATVISVEIGSPDQMIRDIHDISARIFPKPKMLFLNFPNNPTTMCVERDFFDEVVRVARKFGTIVVHDLAYGATVFDDYESPSFLQGAGAKDVGIEFTTMSKEFNMAGWRVGYCVGHPDIIAALKRVKGYYDYGLFQPIQIASIIAFRQCESHAREQAKVYQQRRDVLCAGLQRIGWDVQKPKASMFVWAPIPEPYRSMGSIEFAFQLLDHAEVAVAPGRAFGEFGEGYLRLALVENENRMKQAVRQIGRVFPGKGASGAG